MKSRTGWLVVLLVGIALALAIWIAIAERPGDAVAARHAAPSQPLADLPTATAPSAERIEAGPEPAAAEPSAPPAAITAPPKDAAPAQRSVWLAVVTHDNAPVIGAQVAVSERMDPGPDARKLVGATDVAGRIELVLDGVNEKYVRAFTLDHSSSGWARLSKLELAVNQARVLRVERMAHVVGFVLGDADLPQPRARVELEIAGQMIDRPFAEHLPRLATDDKGRFESYVDAFGSSFRATATVGDERSSPHEFRPEPGQEIEFTLHLGDELTVSGVVLTPDLSVAANASVVVRSDPKATDDRNPFAKKIDCDDRGRFRCALPHSGRFGAGASGEPWGSSDTTAFAVSIDEPNVALELVLTRPATIEGRVTRDDGAPLAGIDVVAHHERCSKCSGPDRDANTRLGILRAKTDADGRFVLGPARVDPHLYAVACAPDPQRPKAVLIVENVAAGTRDVAIVVSEAALIGAVFEGRVVLEDTGAPLTAMEFQLSRWRAPYWQHFRDETVRSDDGRFRIESLQPGVDHAAFIYPIAGYLPVIIERWTASRDSKTVELKMPRPRVLDVTVTDERGMLVDGAIVKFEVEPAHPAFEGYLVNKSNRDGFARMNFWPGSFSISASLGDRHSEPVQVVIGDRNAPLTIVVPSK